MAFRGSRRERRGEGRLGLQAGLRRLRLFGRARDGATAIEFTLLIIPFLLIVFSTIETGMNFTARQVLWNATQNVARQIQTGQVRGSDLTDTRIRTMLCDQIQFMVKTGCEGLTFNLGTYSGFASVPTTGILTDEGDLARTGISGTNGTSTINQLNVLYRWPVLTNILYMIDSADAKRGTMPLFSTLTWQNEPFPN
ncbi:pilus assembly protein [Ochrobactrum sp. Q0168]|nr:pilus assembly protein [Ochrobactrum sp. Q0168]